MSDPAPLLTREQRRRLLDALNNLPLFDDEQGRTLLLSDLPATLCQSVQRSDTKIIDLEAIVRTVEGWGTLDDGTPALGILIENARFHGQGGNAGRSLEELTTELGPLLTPKPLTAAGAVKEGTDPASPAVAAAAPPVPPAAEAAAAPLPVPPPQPPVLDVTPAASVAPAPAVLSAGGAVAVRAAFAAGDWEQTITLARGLGADAPPDLARLVAEAWAGLPLQPQSLAGHSKKIVAVAVTPDGRQAVSAGEDNLIIVWDLAGGRQIRNFRSMYDGIKNVTVTLDGLAVLVINETGHLSVYELNSGQEVRGWNVNTMTALNCVVPRPGGTQVLTGGEEGKIKGWDLASGQFQREIVLGGIFPFVRGLAVTPDGQHVLSGSDKALELWDLETSKLVRALPGHDGAVPAVAVLPDGQQAVSGGEDRQVILWDLASGKALQTFTGHTKAVRAVALSPQGTCAVSAGDDDTLRLWDLATGQALVSLPAGVGGVRTLALAPDGRTLVYGGNDPALRLLPLPLPLDLA
jgi:hypothetical protein